MFELKKGTVHALYIIGILVAVIVVLIAVEWGEVQRLTETLSFALTLASLLLALLAIIYGFLSSSLFGQQISDMTSISRDMMSISQEMGDTNKELRASTENLRQEVREIPHRIEQVEQGLNQTQDLIKDELFNRGSTPPSSSESYDLAAQEKLLSGFLSRSSYLGKRALYVAYVSHTRGLFFSPSELSEHLGRGDFGDYLFGWLMALNALVSLQFEVDTNAYAVRTTEMPALLKQDIESQLSNLRESDDENTITVDKIDAYFDEKAGSNSD